VLVLTRRLEEGLVITVPSGETITITVFAVEGDRVKLGIEAPRQVTILRQELCDAVRQQNLAAARLLEPELGAASSETALATVRQLLVGPNGSKPAQDP
jgi:carbon storage regulator